MEHASTPTLTVDAEPTLHLDARKLGMWVFLASEVIFFTALIGAYIVRHGAASVPPFPHARDGFEGVLDESLFIVAINTFVLLSSSFTMVMAYDNLLKDRLRRFRIWLLGTVVGGSLFLGVQVIEYTELIHKGLNLTVNQFGTTFFMLTGIHGFHVFVGVLWLFVILLMSLTGRFSSRNAVPVDMAALYWHFVDLVWVFIFVFVYLLP